MARQTQPLSPVGQPPQRNVHEVVAHTVPARCRLDSGSYFGEIALSGAVRPVARMEQRLNEAARLGFEQAFVPDGSPTAIGGLTITPIKRLSDLVELFAPEASQ